MNVTELSAFIVIVGALATTIFAFMKWRSSGIFVVPSVITGLQERADNLSERLDEEVAKRRTLERTSYQQGIKLDAEVTKRQKLEKESQQQKLKLEEEINKRKDLARRANARIASLEANDAMNQKSLAELHATLDEYSEGIEILIRQIEEKHNSTPEWRPGK